MSLRWRISAVVTVVSVAVALALSLTVHFAFAYKQADEARKLQVDRIDLALREFARTGQPTFGSRVDDPALPGALRVAVRDGDRATQLSDGWIWAAVGVDGHVLSLRSSYRDRTSDLASLDRVLVLGAVCVVVCGAAAGVLIGARLSRRLRRAADAARRVAAGERSIRVRAAIGGSNRDEAAELATAMDAMADTLQARLDAERRVTADIAHELRTPLTGLSAAADLLPTDRPGELVRDRVRALRSLVEDVLEVARLDTATQRADLTEVALGAFAARRVATIAPAAEVRVADDEVVITDPRRLERILANLLTNATKHGLAPVVVEVDGPRIRVRDAGPGFPATLLREGPSRFRKGTDDRAVGGHGLGLTIAMGQAAVLGASLTLANPESGGAVAELTLPSGASAAP
ncbi:sensor histidine kinase [Embleya sp. NPDC020886]|uniref:sensor histidine kinase n=1 Tax=Embleya sp. NPDC020886 TaxID=3363980 RepID=UPI0037A7F035